MPGRRSAVLAIALAAASGMGTIRVQTAGEAVRRDAAHAMAVVSAARHALARSSDRQAPVGPLPVPPPPFDEWLGALRAEAESRGIRREVLDAALAGVTPSSRFSNATARRRSSRSISRRTSNAV
jgi:membrane-bound lytic murein transglycosylase B